MTLGNDMAPLFNDILNQYCVSSLDFKKMIFLYLVNYAVIRPDLAILSIPFLLKDLSDSNPLVRALALRTMSYINVDKFIQSLADFLTCCFSDPDNLVTKTACIAIAKLHSYESAVVSSLVDILRNTINHENPQVIANACAALVDIQGTSKTFNFTLDVTDTSKLIIAMNESTEWGQVYILEALMFNVPDNHLDAEILIERVFSRLSHSNAAVTLTAVKLVLYLLNYIADIKIVENYFKKIEAPIVSLLHNKPEIQYVTLRNILLIIQKYPSFLSTQVRVFFCKYNDPIYVKLTKLEVIFKLTNNENIDIVLPELSE